MRVEIKVSLKRTKQTYIRRDRDRLHKEPDITSVFSTSSSGQKSIK